jgi:hypothetical protein
MMVTNMLMMLNNDSNHDIRYQNTRIHMNYRDHWNMSLHLRDSAHDIMYYDIDTIAQQRDGNNTIT